LKEIGAIAMAEMAWLAMPIEQGYLLQSTVPQGSRPGGA
jgi:hypothetical protein